MLSFVDKLNLSSIQVQTGSRIGVVNDEVILRGSNSKKLGLLRPKCDITLLALG